jgi:hypothetical protein
MNSPSFSQIYSGIPGKKIRFDDFEISWAGEHPIHAGFFLGSEDGRLRSLRIDGNALTTPSISPSGEAVNGVAFSGRVMGVSTRAEVVFIFREETGDNLLPFDGGAHGIITTSSGGFIAPLGHNGLLMMVPIDGPEQLLATAKLDSDFTNLYKLAHCNGNGREDLIVGAARRDGILIMSLETLSDRIAVSHSQFINSPGLDVIDVTSLGSPLWPNAVAWLGADCSIHLSRDILKDGSSQSLRIKELQGAAYTLLQSHGHLFLLTNKAFYIFPNLVDHYLNDKTTTNLASVMSMKIDLVDIEISKNNLFLIAAEYVDAIPLQSIIAMSQNSGASGWTPQFIEETLTSKSTEPIWTLMSSVA